CHGFEVRGARSVLPSGRRIPSSLRVQAGFSPSLTRVCKRYCRISAQGHPSQSPTYFIKIDIAFTAAVAQTESETRKALIKYVELPLGGRLNALHGGVGQRPFDQSQTLQTRSNR